MAQRAASRGLAERYFLRSRRLGFRTWRESDLPFALALWGDPEVTRYITKNGLAPDEIRARLRGEQECQASLGIQYWPIFLLDGDAHVGCCGLRPRSAEPSIPELGVHIASAHWRNGYAFEAATRVIDYAFDVLRVQALFAGHNPHNAASRALLVLLGFAHTHDERYAPTGLMHPSYLLARPRA